MVTSREKGTKSSVWPLLPYLPQILVETSLYPSSPPGHTPTELVAPRLRMDMTRYVVPGGSGRGYSDRVPRSRSKAAGTIARLTTGRPLLEVGNVLASSSIAVLTVPSPIRKRTLPPLPGPSDSATISSLFQNFRVTPVGIEKVETSGKRRAV
jgi:hypothetical protein